MEDTSLQLGLYNIKGKRAGKLQIDAQDLHSLFPNAWKRASQDGQSPISLGLVVG